MFSACDRGQFSRQASRTSGPSLATLSGGGCSLRLLASFTSWTPPKTSGRIGVGLKEF